jgi:hypothetical protein
MCLKWKPTALSLIEPDRKFVALRREQISVSLSLLGLVRMKCSCDRQKGTVTSAETAMSKRKFEYMLLTLIIKKYV